MSAQQQGSAAKVRLAVQALLDYGTAKQLIDADNVIFVRNQLMEALGLLQWETTELVSFDSLDEILTVLVNYACDGGIIADTATARERFDTKLMGFLTSSPHTGVQTFQEAYAESPVHASDWYYQLSKDTNYVRAGRIAQDLRWQYVGEYGTLEITINRSKLEKDPRDIAAARAQAQMNYPACQLCIENTGFPGTASHPAHRNLRPIPMRVGGGRWYLQYSPYGYYPEHCIVFRDTHTPMQIDDTVFGKLFDVLDFLPHYFIGSNADLPIVGGSILSHEHFQGGRHTFAMDNAPVETSFTLTDTPQIEAGIVRWPLSVIRLSGSDRAALECACADVLHAWRCYSDSTAEILAQTADTPYNTITPIARKRGECYVCDLVLRNNRTTPERPLGLFHQRPSLYHIKKENIGLIEVMGLAVLPGRLAGELDEMAATLVGGADPAQSPQMQPHAHKKSWSKTSQLFCVRAAVQCSEVKCHIVEKAVRISRKSSHAIFLLDKKDRVVLCYH
ncbi:MAG: UDP-glucose--hexose-1-phosphate uridylyltransferase [Ruminococcus sp.]|nr:UDP-glucose--hexose-1-phosphate uridylyltransferase [Ruminococcus sp.]